MKVFVKVEKRIEGISSENIRRDNEINRKDAEISRKSKETIRESNETQEKLLK